MTTEDSISDDVFEADDGHLSSSGTAVGSAGLNVLSNESYRTPSPTGYRDYQPPRELLEASTVKVEEVAHKTILLGDSGVGKTSLLVQFDTGKFKGGSFAATVGIGFMVGYFSIL
ncbi:hypothetical protein RUM43_005622 [Polyplax serrata]|uniref:Ras-related protein Rab-26 n=1 Tax=Polyplax serrata TaxID=468196 RepID=A0AAN8PBG2_POLSC